MKKYGKFEKRSEPVEGKTPQVKSMLLQTYLTSLLCMVLCVTMFLGTSYAWFSSEVTNTTNEIYVGTLKVGLYRMEGETPYDLSLAGEGAPKLFEKSFSWEPGYTALETLRIENEGDLAFKYTLNFKDASVANSTKTLADVAKYFELWVYDHQTATGTYSAPASYSAITADSGWKHFDLEEVLNGTAILDNVEMTAIHSGSDARNPDAIHTYTLALHMNENAGADIMGASLNLSVKLVAYQMVSEQDDINLADGYDDVVAVSGQADAETALAAGKNVTLTSDLTTTSALVMNHNVLEGGKFTITYAGTKDENSLPVGVLTTTGGMVSNLTIAGSTNGCALYAKNLNSNLTVTNCIFDGLESFKLNSTDAANCDVSFDNAVFKTSVYCANKVKVVSFDTCQFGNLVELCGDAELTDCTFYQNSWLDVTGLEKGERILLSNCTYNGTLIESAVIANIDGTIVIEGTDGLTTQVKLDDDSNPIQTLIVLNTGTTTVTE